MEEAKAKKSTENIISVGPFLRSLIKTQKKVQSQRPKRFCSLR